MLTKKERHTKIKGVYYYLGTFTAIDTGHYSKPTSYKINVNTMADSLTPITKSMITFSNLVDKGEAGTK